MDLLLTSNANDLYLWSRVGSSFTIQRVAANYPVGWTLAGIGDVNGDGKDDLVWQQAGNLVCWIMDGGVVTRTSSFHVSSQYHVIGVGDFNGDSLLDLLWTSSANDLYVWRGNGAGFVAERSATAYPAGWTLAGVGDVDGDGKSDLVWQQTGRVAYWTMSDAVVTRSAAFYVSTSYSVIGTGDYNGDGKLDLVLTSAANDLSWWRGSGNSFIAAPMSVNYPVGWTLVSK